MKALRFATAACQTILLCGIALALYGEELRLIGRATISAMAIDLSDQTDRQENGTPQNRLGGHGSGIAWTGDGDRYFMLPDRGPDDGATSYRCRIQQVEIVVNASSKTPVNSRLLKTEMLTNSAGKNVLGRASQFNREHPERSLRLDAERAVFHFLPVTRSSNDGAQSRFFARALAFCRIDRSRSVRLSEPCS